MNGAANFSRRGQIMSVPVALFISMFEKKNFVFQLLEFFQISYLEGVFHDSILLICHDSYWLRVLLILMQR